MPSVRFFATYASLLSTMAILSCNHPCIFVGSIIFPISPSGSEQDFSYISARSDTFKPLPFTVAIKAFVKSFRNLYFLKLIHILLLYSKKPKRDVFYEFKGKKLTSDILDDLKYQFMRRLQKEGLVKLKKLFIDGTKNKSKC